MYFVVRIPIPNLPHGPHLTFDAVLKEPASPKTGFHAVLAKAKSGPATLQGFRVQVTGGDASFVPHTEKIQITYSVTDPGGVAVPTLPGGGFTDPVLPGGTLASSVALWELPLTDAVPFAPARL